MKGVMYCQIQDTVWCFSVEDKREVANKHDLDLLLPLCSSFQIAAAVILSITFCQSVNYINYKSLLRLTLFDVTFGRVPKWLAETMCKIAWNHIYLFACSIHLILTLYFSTPFHFEWISFSFMTPLYRTCRWKLIWYYEKWELF